MASLTGKLVADTYKALLKLIDNDILTASEKQISDGFGGGSGVFIDQNGFLRASQYKVTGGTSAQFLKGDGSLDSNTYLTSAVANTLYLPIGSTTTAIAEGTRLYFTTARVLATTLTGFVATSGTVTASDTILTAIDKIWWNIVNGGGGGGGYVPYTGATQNLNLGTYGLLGDFVQFNTTNSAIPVTAGTMSWNNTDGTADLKLKGGNVTLQVGQEQVTRVVNKTGTNLLESQYHAVYISGAQGQRLKVDLALAVTDGTSAGTIGLVTENINNNQEGFVTSSGLVNEINTTGSLQGETWADGDILYLSPLVAGDVTNIKPLAPEHTVIIGFVVYAHANHGKIYVKVDNGYEIEELHDVQVIDRTDTDILQWYEDDLVWRNIQFETALENAGGIIGLGDINYVPRFDGTNSISNSRIFDDLDNVIIGGTVGIIPNPFGMADMLTVLNGNIAIEGAYSYRIDTHQILQRTNATGEFRIGTDVIGDFITLYAGTSEKARLTAAGYLGLGVTSPSSIIHAKDSTAYGKVIIDNTGATGGGSFSARQNGTETAIFGVSGAWQANTTSDAAIVATRGGQGIKFYTDGSSTAKGGIDSVGNSFIGQLPAYYTGATNFIVQGISAAALIGITHADNSIKGVFSTLNSGVNIGSETPHPVIFRADDIESARIASDGKWLFGTNVNDNVNIVQVNGSIIATSLKKSGGIATEFLKADGSVDSNTYYLASNPSSFISLTSLSSTAFGLTYTNTTGVFSLTAGFEIPTTTDTTNWDTAYLNRITSATAPLSITSNVISISQASGSTNGYLSSTDWTTFNNKSNTNGTVTSVSGAGTVSGLTLTGTVTTTGSLTLGGTLSLTSLNVTTALGFTPVTNARTLTINGTTYDLTADRSWTIAAGISTLTTLGNSGPATLVGSTLNVPNYSAGSSAVRNVSTFTATSGQTTFTIIGGYTVGLIDVFINGARLSTADYTATNSSTVVLGIGAVLNDIVDVVNYTATFTAGISGTGTANFLTKWTGTSAVSNSIIFDNTSAIGIGTNAPRTSASGTNKTLDVKGGIYFGDSGAESCTINNDDSMIFNIDANNTSTSNFFRWATNTTLEAGGKELMRLSEAGFLGIGTTAADYAITISGATEATSGIRIKNTDGVSSAPRLIIEQANAQKMQMYAYTDSFVFNYSLTQGIAFYDGVANANRFYINGSGNIGIGTVSQNISGGASGTTVLTLSASASGRNSLIELKGTRTSSGQISNYIRSFSNSATSPGVDLVMYRGTADTDGEFAINTSGSERMRISSAGYCYLGDGWGSASHRINLKVGQGSTILCVSGYDSVGNDTAIFYASGGNSGSFAGTNLWLSKNSSTNRSINAGGTINASGADYAEYMTKSVNDIINKGDIVGIDINGKLTNIYLDAISFVVKSTDPSYVGGDNWFNHEKRPTKLEIQTDDEFAIILSNYEQKLEIERAKVDRISFSGQVPCNVLGANVGDYIIPINKNGKIDGIAISNPTLEQYRISVGKVWKIMDDGRAWIAVKIG